MYIARKNILSERKEYVVRQSCMVDGQLGFQDLFDLGHDPSVYIQYPGGNAYLFDEALEDALYELVADYDSDDLEVLLWPWIRPDIKRAVETFRNRSSSRPGLTRKEKEQISALVHPFDKRRTLYLRTGSMDQGPVEKMPAVLFTDFKNKSRDEIEQQFFQQESGLKAHEFKSYVYTIFDLQRFFQSFMAKKMPHVLDQEKVDEHFITEICRINLELFKKRTYLHTYMIRYCIMFFDHTYAGTTLLDDFAAAFMNRHRRYTPPPPKKNISRTAACKIFKITPKELKTMTKSRLTKKYRKLARKCHPDTGGGHDTFIALNDAYQHLLSVV